MTAEGGGAKPLSAEKKGKNAWNFLKFQKTNICNIKKKRKNITLILTLKNCEFILHHGQTKHQYIE